MFLNFAKVMLKLAFFSKISIPISIPNFRMNFEIKPIPILKINRYFGNPNYDNLLGIQLNHDFFGL